MIKKFGVVLAGIMLAVFGASVPAQASLSQCAQASICVWTGGTYNGAVAQYTAGTVSAAGCWKFGTSQWNNNVHSYANTWSIGGARWGIILWNNGDCTGSKYVDGPVPDQHQNINTGFGISSISVTQIA